VDACNVVKLFEIDTAEVYLSLNFPKGTFDVTCMVHPVSYLNKILFASQQGTMQLWNMKTSKLVYTYKSFNSAITCLKQAPAIDVCGIGLEDGRIILHNLKYDETLMTFLQEWGAVKSLTFRTGIQLEIVYDLN
jgi:U3 small nucleolar RNA-associated protein 21